MGSNNKGEAIARVIVRAPPIFKASGITARVMSGVGKVIVRAIFGANGA